MTKEIELTKGKKAIVDDEDFEWLNQWKWYAAQDRNTFYAVRKEGRKTHQKRIIMHRLIMNAPYGAHVDHLNGNGLDNRRSNMRLATCSQNQMNRGPEKNNTSGYKGVSWNKARRKWKTQITTDGKRKHLGYFARREDAAHAYNEAAKKHFGPFAWLNKLIGGEA